MANNDVEIRISAQTAAAEKSIKDLTRTLERLSTRINSNIASSDENTAAAKKGTLQNNKNTKSVNLLSGAMSRLAIVYTGFRILEKVITDTAKVEKNLLAISKTTNIAGKELDALKEQILEMSTTLAGVRTDELFKIGEIAGQLGVKGSENILVFTETVAMMAASTDLDAEAAAKALYKLSNVMKLPTLEIEKLSSVINHLSNNSSASAAEIVDLAQRISGGAQMLGISTPQMMAYTATVKDLGETTEVAGTSIAKMFSLATIHTEKFAKIAGVDIKEFKYLLETDAHGAITKFLEGLAKLDKFAKVPALQEIGLGGAFASKTMMKLSDATLELTHNTEEATQAFKDANSTQKEFEIQGKGLTAQYMRFKNILISISDAIGTQLNPHMKKGLDTFKGWTDEHKKNKTFENIGKSISATIIKIKKMTQSFTQLLEKSFALEAISNGFKIIGMEVNAAIDGYTKLFKVLDMVTTSTYDVRKSTSKQIEEVRELTEAYDRNKESLAGNADKTNLMTDMISSQITENKKLIAQYLEGHTQAERESVERLIKANRELNKILKDVNVLKTENNKLSVENTGINGEALQYSRDLVTQMEAQYHAQEKIKKETLRLYDLYKEGTTKAEIESAKLLKKQLEEQSYALFSLGKARTNLSEKFLKMNEAEQIAEIEKAEDIIKFSNKTFEAKSENLDKWMEKVAIEHEKELLLTEEKYKKELEGLEKKRQSLIEDKQKTNEEIIKLEKDHVTNLNKIDSDSKNRKQSLSDEIREIETQGRDNSLIDSWEYHDAQQEIEKSLADFKSGMYFRSAEENNAMYEKIKTDITSFTDKDTEAAGSAFSRKEEINAKVLDGLKDLYETTDIMRDSAASQETEVHNAKIAQKNLELEMIEAQLVAEKALIEAIYEVLSAITEQKIEPDTSALDGVIQKLQDTKNKVNDVTATPLNINVNDEQVDKADRKLNTLDEHDTATRHIVTSNAPLTEGELEALDNREPTNTLHMVLSDVPLTDEELDKLDERETDSEHKVEPQTQEIEKTFEVMNKTKTKSPHDFIPKMVRVNSEIVKLNNTVTTSIHKFKPNTSAVDAAKKRLRKPSYSIHYIREVIIPAGRANGGEVLPKFAGGGQTTFSGFGRVPGYDSSDGDSVVASVPPKSFVINRKATDFYGRENLDNLVRNNKATAMLTKGEYVMPPSVVNNISTSTAHSINNMEFPKFAGGGEIGNGVPNENNNNFNITVNASNDINDIMKQLERELNKVL